MNAISNTPMLWARLHEKYPDDVDAAALYALSILGTAHCGRNFAIYMKALAILEPLFYAHPDHPGVNHYLIHSVDDPIHAPLGLAAARNYSKIALDAAHAQHMTSHIFVAMGMWDDTVKSNLEALKIENEQNAQHGRPPEYCGHYTSWLEYGYLEEGRLGDAGQVLKQCRVAALNGAARRQPQDMANINMYAHMFARYLLDSEDWNGEVAQLPALPRGKDDDADTIATLDFVDGFSAARRGDVKAAKSALADLTTTDKTVNAKAPPTGAPPNPVMRRITLLDQELEAAIDASEGNRDKAIDLLQEVASEEMTIPFEYGPPFIDKPPEELLGEVLLSAGDAKEANMAFQGALSRTPERTQSLMGVWRSLKASGDTNGAASVVAKLHTIWHNADQIPSELR